VPGGGRWAERAALGPNRLPAVDRILGAGRGRRLAWVLALLGVCAVTLPVALALASTRSVGVRDSYFSVKRLTISRGTKVRWSWGGVLNHNVTVKSGPSRFHSRTQVTGSYSHTFTKRGTYKLYCSIHPGMTMTVVVR
jgi:plastocyanin